MKTRPTVSPHQFTLSPYPLQRHERVPGATVFGDAGRLIFLSRRFRHVDEMLAVGALKPASHQIFRDLDVLAAVRTGKFEFAHCLMAFTRSCEIARWKELFNFSFLMILFAAESRRSEQNELFSDINEPSQSRAFP